MTNPYPYILKNNEIIPQDEVEISLNHGGFLYGYGVFESVLIDQKKTCFIDEHIARLRHSASYINLSLSDAIDSDMLKKHIKRYWVFDTGAADVSVFKNDIL